MGATWSRPRVIDELRHWHARGVGVDQIWRQSRALAHAAKNSLRSWRLALAAAGLGPHKAPPADGQASPREN